MSDDASGIFEGLIVHTLPLPGRHLYASHDRIAELRERGVVLSVERDELHPFGERFARARRPRETMESPARGAAAQGVGLDHGRLDVGFFWRLFELLPAAAAAAGELDEAVADIHSLGAQRGRSHRLGSGEVAEMLRPFYLEYLRHRRADAASTP